jgi:hypothetical protein
VFAGWSCWAKERGVLRRFDVVFDCFVGIFAKRPFQIRIEAG